MKTIIIKTQAELDALRRLYSKTKVTKRGCWFFTGNLDAKGYGRFFFRGKHTSAHAASWILSGKRTRKGMDLMHECDNKKCINPSHLSLGSRRTNVRDAVRRGLIKKGVHHPMASLRKHDVKRIVRLRDSHGWSFKLIAQQLDVHLETVRRYYNTEKKYGHYVYKNFGWKT